jgi:hypothetical protein
MGPNLNYNNVWKIHPTSPKHFWVCPFHLTFSTRLGAMNTFLKAIFFFLRARNKQAEQAQQAKQAS